MASRNFWDAFFAFVVERERRAEERGAALARLGASLGDPTDQLAAAVAANSLDLPGSPGSPRALLLRRESMANPILTTLPEEVTRTIGVMESAEVLITGFQTRLSDAITQALANGASAQELAPLKDLETALKDETSQLAAAVAANTPPAPEPQPPSPTPPGPEPAPEPMHEAKHHGKGKH
jgi:hypothetical protein